MLETMTTSPYVGANYAYPTMQYANIKRPTMTQPLTIEEQQALASKGGAFSTMVAKEDIYKSICTHKKDGQLVLHNNGDGTYTCPVCQETFAEPDLDPQHVREVTREMINMLQMIKTCYMDIPENTAREFFPIISLLEKVPQLSEIAMRNFAQYEQGTMIQNGGNPYSFNAYQSLIGGPAYQGYGAQQPMMQPMASQPMYQQPMQQPMYQPQPMAMAPQQVQVTPQFNQNGFVPVNEFGAYGAGQPVMAQPMMQPQYQQQMVQPMAMAPQQMMQQPVQQQAPAANPQPAAAPTVDTSTFTL